MYDPFYLVTPNHIDAHLHFLNESLACLACDTGPFSILTTCDWNRARISEFEANFRLQGVCSKVYTESSALDSIGSLSKCTENIDLFTW